MRVCGVGVKIRMRMSVRMCVSVRMSVRIKVMQMSPLPRGMMGERGGFYSKLPSVNLDKKNMVNTPEVVTNTFISIGFVVSSQPQSASEHNNHSRSKYLLILPFHMYIIQHIFLLTHSLTQSFTHSRAHIHIHSLNHTHTYIHTLTLT